MSNSKGKCRLDDSEDIQDLISSVIKLRDYLKPSEEVAIHRQFRGSLWKPNRQVLWSGILREQAQVWADGRDMQTLTTAMGPLMDTRTPTCLHDCKSPNAWSKYIHGASAVFAWHIARGDVVTVLCPPPPQRFHPSGRVSYQVIEEPILRAAMADGAALRVELVHPLVKGAEDFRYQLLPCDEMDTWTAKYGTTSCRKCVWRMVKGDVPSAAVKSIVKPLPAVRVEKKGDNTAVSPCVKSVSNCQQTLSKKSKKRKAKGKKQAPCASTLSLSSAAPPTKSLNVAVPSTPKSKAQKKAAADAKVVKATPKAAAKANNKATAASSGHATKSTPAAAAPAPKLTKAQKRKAKKARRTSKGCSKGSQKSPTGETCSRKGKESSRKEQETVRTKNKK